MSKFSLTVTHDPEVEKKLKAGGYKLCICKRVGDKAYNVVWLSGKDFKAKNHFVWTESYAVFGSEDFKDGALAHTSTAVQNIKFGQTCLLTKNGVLEPPTGAVKPTGHFFVDNDCLTDMHIGVSQAIGNDTSKKTPIFMTDVFTKGLTDLEPRVQLLVFFDKELETQMMFTRAVTRATEIEYAPGETSKHARFNAEEEWEVSGQVRARLAYHPNKGFFSDEESFL